MTRLEQVGIIPLLGLTLLGCHCGDLQKSTRYAKGYSEDRFRKIRPGMSLREVVSLMGTPLNISTQSWAEVWIYGNPDSGWVEKPSSKRELHIVNSNLAAQFTSLEYSASGIVISTSGRFLPGRLDGSSKSEILAKFGEPNQREITPFSIVYHYSRLGNGGAAYEIRQVHFDQADKVISTIAKRYFD